MPCGLFSKPLIKLAMSLFFLEFSYVGRFLLNEKGKTLGYSPCQIFFWKGPDKYFRLCRPYEIPVAITQPLLCGEKAGFDDI